MKNNKTLKLLSFLAFIFTLSIFLTNCKGKVEIHSIQDSIANCSAPYIVYFKADADHRSRKLEYTWDFGDGTSSHELEPQHIYQENGIYNVTLLINQNKVSNSKSISLNLNPENTQVVSDYDYSTKTKEFWAPAKVEFTNYSQFATSFLWDFNDGDSSKLINPVHIFETSGQYRTLLNAMCNGDTSKYYTDIVIKSPPGNIIVDKVTVWMPNSVIGKDIMLEVWYAGRLEKQSGWINSVQSFPITFNTERVLRYFDGNYNSELLEFMIFVDTDEAPTVRFTQRADNLQGDFYPSIIGFDDGYGRKLEALIDYR